MSVSSTTIPGYELVRELGAGGMANVYLAIQRSLDRKIALKVMKRNIEDLEKFEKRFLIEGRTMAKLPHRNIVAVYDIVKSDDATYIAMEYLEGGTLSQKMKEGLSLAEAISVVVQIAQALQFAHEHSIVHRDLKPANIMFRDPATPVLTDFGIAKQQDAQSTRLTQTGMLVGTPTYMSPEQINALEVDGRSDLYSLGVLFYEMLTGTPPFVADTPIAVLMAHLTAPPPPLPPQFADFQPVIDRMLAKNRDERFGNLKDLVRSLKGAVVNNQNLWARLQADPNQSSSEQLRALGFSISGGENLQVPITGQVRLPPSGRAQPRTPTPAPSPAPRGPSDDIATEARLRPPPRGKPWALIGGGAAALIAIVVIAVLMWPRGELDPSTKKLVDNALATVQTEIKKGNLDQARELLISAADSAPKYSGTLAVTQELLGAYRAQIEQALGKKDFTTATALLLSARLIDDKNDELNKLLDRVDAERKNAEQAAQLAELFKRADDAARAGRELGPGSAYDLLSQARAQMPDNAEIKTRLTALLARVLKPARDALARNDVVAAQTVVRDTETLLANEPEWQTLKSQVETAQQQAEARARLATVLATIDRQLQSGRLVEPAGDNAQETLTQAQAIDARNPDIVRRQTALAQALTARAQASLNAGKIELALQDANFALNVQAGYPQALALKSNAEGRLGENRARVIDALGAAKQALLEGRYLAPAGRNAKESLETVLKLDAANTEARQLLDDLPRRVAEAVRARLAENDLDDAKSLLADGRRLYPADAALTAIAGELDQKMLAAKAQEERAHQFERITQLIAARPLKADNVGAAARDIGALLAANPRDVDAATAKQRLLTTLGESLTAATSTSELDVIDQAIGRARASFAGEATLDRLATDLTSARQKIAADEQARLAALSGELIINAYPWATVESVVDANRRPVALPTDATTPLRLSLPAGVYTITYRHPQVGRAATQVAQVESRKAVTANASFAGAVGAKDYLKRAGF